jgi:3-phenylpropionate/trans-cinnamate dioxygenase ferredoxin component
MKGTVVGRDVEGADVTCPWHGAKFDVRTGAVLGPPAGQALKTYPVRVTGADIEIEM